MVTAISVSSVGGSGFVLGTEADGIEREGNGLFSGDDLSYQRHALSDPEMKGNL